MVVEKPVILQVAIGGVPVHARDGIDGMQVGVHERVARPSRRVWQIRDNPALCTPWPHLTALSARVCWSRNSVDDPCESRAPSALDRVQDDACLNIRTLTLGPCDRHVRLA
jgi:hypothetical protein